MKNMDIALIFFFFCCFIGLEFFCFSILLLVVLVFHIVQRLLNSGRRDKLLEKKDAFLSFVFTQGFSILSNECEKKLNFAGKIMAILFLKIPKLRHDSIGII